MKIVTLLTIAATAIALSLAPAGAKSKKKHPRAYPQQYGQTDGYQPYGSYGYQPYGAYGWTGRNVSDPSLGHPSAADISRRTGRCVEDLGYGRYEACGW
jgi:hypothetical protein